MKKFAIIMLLANYLLIAACNSATKQKSGNGADSGTVGNSGAAVSGGNGSAAGNSNATTDTSTTGKQVTNPTVDSGKTPRK